MCGILFQPGAWWIGVHKSDTKKRLCINIIPLFTIWVLLPGGRPPSKKSLVTLGKINKE